MNRAELVAAVDAALGDRADSAQSAALVTQIVDSIVRAVAAGEKVSLTGFGVFEQQQRAARRGRNLQTGEQIDIPPTSTPVFRSALQFKEIVAGHRAFPDSHTLASRTTLAPQAATITAATPAAVSATPEPTPVPASADAMPPALDTDDTPSKKSDKKKSNDKKSDKKNKKAKNDRSNKKKAKNSKKGKKKTKK